VATLEDLLIKVGIDTKGVAKGSQDVQSKLSKTWDMAKGVAAAGGLAVGAAAMAGLNMAIEQSKPAALLEAQLGAGTPLAAEAGKAAGMVYARGVATSMEDATASVRAAVQNALVPPNASAGAIDKVAAKITNLGQVMQEDAGRVSAAVSQMIRTGLVDSADEGFDLLQRGVEMGVNKSEDLLDTFNEYGTQFRKIGLDGPTAMGLMSQALQAGARDSDTVADALKELAIRAVDGSKTSADAYKALGLDAEKMTSIMAKGGDYAAEGLDTILTKLRAMKDPVAREAAAVGLFGTKAEDLGDALYAMDPLAAADKLGKLGGAADRAGQSLEQSAGAKLEAFKRQAQAALVEQLAKAIPYIEATFGWLSRNSGWVVPLATALGILAAAIGVIVAVQWAWNAALALSPVTWIIIGIVALIAVIVLIATKTKWFQNIWNALWGFMKGVGAWFAGPFANFFVQAWNKIVAGAKWVWNSVKTQFLLWRGLFNLVRSWVSSAVSFVTGRWDRFVSRLRSSVGSIKSTLSRMWDGMKSAFRTAINYVVGKWNSLRFTLPSFTILGKSFGGGTIGVPRLPMLADGGITTGPTLAMIGEGREQEAVIPLSKLPDIAQSRDDKPTVVQVTPGGEREFRRWIRKSLRVNGQSLVEA
jgi:hypothetical protein